MIALNYITSRVADWPLETASSDNANPVSRAFASATIPLFSLLSFGKYGAYAEQFYKEREIRALLPETGSAMDRNDVNKIKELFASKPDSMREILKGYRGNVPLLHQAVFNGCQEMSDLLLEMGADIQANSRMGTPLAVAIQVESLQLIDYLLEKKANPNVGDRRSPLRIAMFDLRAPIKLEVVDRLVKNGADLNDEGYAESLLSKVSYQWACHPEKTRETLLLLLQNGARLKPNEVIENTEARAFILANGK
jgi:hypothetical protein